MSKRRGAGEVGARLQSMDHLRLYRFRDTLDSAAHSASESATAREVARFFGAWMEGVLEESDDEKMAVHLLRDDVKYVQQLLEALADDLA